MLKRIIPWAAGARTIVEPFAGGASASLGCVLSGAVDRAVLAERDPGVRALWQTVLGPADAEFERLCDCILHEVGLSRAWFADFASGTWEGSPLWRRAALTLVRCRFGFGGIPHPRVGLVSDPQVQRLWRGESMVARMRRIRPERHRFTVAEDAMAVIEEWRSQDDACFFVDPPYSYGEGSPGAKLYLHHEVDHDALLASLSGVAGRVMATYDHTPAAVALGMRHGFQTAPWPCAMDGDGSDRSYC